jgi:hypothetical protein
MDGTGGLTVLACRWACACMQGITSSVHDATLNPLLPGSCTTESDGTQIVNEMGTADNPGPCYDPNAGVDSCLGSEARSACHACGKGSGVRPACPD